MELDFLDEDFLEQATKTVKAGSKFRPKPKLGPKSASKPSLIHTTEPKIKDGKNTCTERANSDKNDDSSCLPLEVVRFPGGDDYPFPSIQSAGLDLHPLPPASSVEVLGDEFIGSTFTSCFSLNAIINEPCEPSTIAMPASHDGTNSLDVHIDDEQFHIQDETSYHGLNSVHSNAFGEELASDIEIGEFGTEVRYSVPTENDCASLPNDSEGANPSKAADLNFLENEAFEDLRQFSTNAMVDVWQSFDPSDVDTSNVPGRQGSEPCLDESHPEMPTVTDEFSETIRESNCAASSNRQSKRVAFADIDREREIGTETSSALVEEEQSRSTDEVFATFDENKSSELPKRTRKRVPVANIDEYENANTEELEDDAAEDPLYSIGNDTNKKKKTTKRRKIPEAGRDIQGHGGKKQTAGNSSASKAPEKKKISHTTRRSRKIDQRIKELLEMPEEDVDPKKLMMKDLILLAKMKEKKMGKESAASKTSSTNKRSGDSYNGDSLFDENDNNFHTEGQNSDDGNCLQEEPRPEPTPFKLNYHSFMAKTPRERWSGPLTQLFYEAVRQFGSDFAMIQQMFSGWSRRQIKLKYKAEEKKHPTQMADALMHRSKDHSHCELVLERVKAAQAERQANAWSDSPVPDGEEEGEEGNCNEGADASGEGNGGAEEAKCAADLENNVDSIGKEDEMDEDYDWNNYTSFDTYSSDPKESLDT